MAGKTYQSPTATPGRRYTVIAKEPYGYVLYNFNANNKAFHFNAKTRAFHFNAKTRGFNFNAKTGA
ncbi:unnamed protein product [marine sediment metagenome]|uniref:Uncharacterized protein n=1 Tax=marine sediment metagenome TaxID=412755 RepID=X0V6B8_9ZZZZ